MIHSSILPFLPKIKRLLKMSKVKNAYFFGSVVSDSFSEESDLDLIVNLQDDIDPVEAGEVLWNLIFELEDLTKRKVDLLTERSLRNPYFIEEVNRTKFPIYGFSR